MKNTTFLLLAVILVITSQINADSDVYTKHVSQIQNLQLNTQQVFTLENDTIRNHDLQVIFKTGTVSFLQPLLSDSDTIYYGCYFEGNGLFQFSPPIDMEKKQIERFFQSDSLNRSFDKILLFFSSQIFDSLKQKTEVSEISFQSEYQNSAEKLFETILTDAGHLYTFDILRNIVQPFGDPYLLISVKPYNTDNLIYSFNPNLREEIFLRKKFWEPGRDFMELVSSYSQYNRDESYSNINGRDKAQLDTKQYTIDAKINEDGVLQCRTDVRFDVLTGPTQFVEVMLLPSLIVDSILDVDNNKVSFVRERLDVSFKDWETYQIGLLLNRQYMYKDTLELTFYYSGEIAQKNIGELYIFAGATWYPRYGFGDRALFDMTFKTDKEYTFTACGNKLSSKTDGDFRVTTWKVIPEARNVSFNMGYMKKYLFEEEDLPPVEVYYSKELHNSIANSLSESLVAVGKNMEKQVFDDISNTLRVYNHYFGEYTYPNIRISEILQSHSEAFPGFIHLGFDTWINTDHWGNDRRHRAHETAHQWWGVGVGYETYHDQWLSEGFAEYSSLMYLQVVMGNETFLEKLKDYRNEIFSARKYLFGSGEESGPIALGYRTSSTKTSGDYGLIIYKKGAYVLHMLRNMLIDLKTMNEDLFMQMMKEFYGSYRGKEASTQDFRRLAEKYTGIDLGWFFNQWINHNYLPECEFKYDFILDPNTNLYTAKCRVITKNVPEDFKMYMPLELRIDNQSKAYIRLFIESNDFSFELPNLPQKPKKLILNPFESVLAKIDQ